MVHTVDDLQRGRESYERRAWTDAHEALACADRLAELGPRDLELLARSAYMLGRDAEYVDGLERAHHAYLDAGDARSLEALRDYLDPATRGLTENTYFEVDSGFAIGLPQAAVATV